MEQNTMLILLLSLLLLCDLLHCGELRKANFNATVRTEHAHKARRYDNFVSRSSPDIMSNSTPGTHRMDWIVLQHPVLTTPTGSETNTRDDPPSSLSVSITLFTGSLVPPTPKLEPIHPQASSLQSPSNSLNVSLTLNTTCLPSPTGSMSKGTNFSSANVERSFPSVCRPGFGLDPFSYPAETPAINIDPSVVEFAKKWLQGVASTTANTPKRPVPKLSKILDYDHTTQGFPLAMRRNQKTLQRKIINRQLKNNTLKHQPRAIARRGDTVPQGSKRGHSEAEANMFWHDPPPESTTAIKQRLKPGLLLGKATISAVRNTEDIKGRERIMRMHHIQVTTKKQWYSDRTEVQLEEMETTTPTTEKQFLRDITRSAPATHSSKHTSDTSTASTAQTLTTIKDKPLREKHQHVPYMMVFLIELARLIATKEEKAVHDVLKHANQIIHGFYKSGQLQWFGQPLIDVTRKLARSLKETEIVIIQKQAADLQQTLTQRRQMLSDEVNAILERAGSLYDDDEGAHLLEVLNEFAAYPNTTLSGYWLCNSLMNNFLRPYRRLADTRQRQQLTDSVNIALQTRFTSSGATETTALRSGGLRQAFVPPDESEHPTPAKPPNETKQALRGRNRKRHHRSRKRKRGRKRYRMHRYRPDGKKRFYIEGNRERDNEGLLLRSVAPRTSLQPVLVTTLQIRNTER